MKFSPAAIAIGAYLLVMALVAWLALPLQPNGDDFVGMADQLLAGQVPRDPFRPLLYPLLTAGLGACIGDTLLAGKLVSVAATGVFLLSSLWLGRELTSAGEAAFAVLLLAVHAVTVGGTLAASTDMTFAAFHGLSLWAAVRLAKTGSRRHLLWLALFSALAYFTRYQAMLLLVPVGLAMAVAPGGMLERLLRAPAFLAVAAACLLPHCILTFRVFGRVLHEENWRNVALKHYADLSFDRIHDLPFDGMMSVLMHDPAKIAAGCLNELWDFLTGGFAAFLQGAPGIDVIGVLLASTAGIGIVMALLAGSAARRIVTIHLVVYVVALSLTFVLLPRLLLPILPICMLALTRAAASLVDRAALRNVAGLRAALSAALLVSVAWHTPGTLSNMRDSMPTAEVAAANRLAASVPYPVTVLTTSAQVQRDVPPHLRLLHLHAPYGTVDVAAYVARIQRRAAELRAAYVLLGRAGIDSPMLHRIRELLPPELPIVEEADDILLLRVAQNTIDWIETSSAIADAPDGVARLEIRLRRDVAGTLVARVGFVARSKSGTTSVIELQLSADGVATATSPAPEHGWESCTLIPVVYAIDGRLGCAEAVAVALR